MKTLKDLFLDELADMYDAEKRIVKALPKIAKAATCEDLKAAIMAHLEETKGHVTKLEQVFETFEEKAQGKTCEATVGLLKEGDEIAADFKGSPAINAALVSAAQKVEHYEMASYGCLQEWAKLLDNEEAAEILEGILQEEKAANDSLTALARSTCNQQALEGFKEMQSDENESDEKASDDDADEKPNKKSSGARPSAATNKRAEVMASK